MSKMVIALAGNPNSGKTTLFNALTGANQTVGNWPGVTVEHKEGKLKKDKDITVCDLPGVYSLSPYTQEEVVSRNYLVDAKPDVIINIVDGSNLERNLYLTTQLCELGVPVVVAINMMDVVRKRGDAIDSQKLGRELGVKVVEISALKNDGISELVDAATNAALALPGSRVDFGSTAEAAIKEIEGIACEGVPETQKRWYAIKLFERDEKVLDKLDLSSSAKDAVGLAIANFEKEDGEEPEAIVASKRYDYIESVVSSCVKRANEGELSTSDKIDKVVTSRVLGLPIFAIVMVLVYYLSISTVGTMATDWVNDNLFGEGFFLGDFSGEVFDEYMEAKEVAEGPEEDYLTEAEEAVLESEGGILIDGNEAEEPEVNSAAAEESQAAILAESGSPDASEALSDVVEEVNPYDYGAFVPSIPDAVSGALESMDTSPVLTGLVVDGIVAGIGAMLGFLPQMFVLFVLLALLEGCGYMARVAFVLDRVFRRFGLSGKSFIPILIGTGCGVPGIMASRTIENESDRRMTIMTTTFIPCSAKIPVIALIAAAVFGGAWWVAPSAYFVGLATILCTGVILKKTKAFAGDTAPFVMEMPAYHLPTLGYIGRSVWDRCWSFIKKAFTILLLATILIWFLSNFGVTEGGFGMVEDANLSILAAIGSALAFIFAPLGWSDWQSVSAVIAGFMAKEEIVGTIGVLFAAEGGNWLTAFQSTFLPAAGYSFLTFNLLCMPCFAAVSTIASEMKDVRWTLGAIGYQFAVAWVVSLWVFQFGGLATGEASFGIATIVAAALLVGFAYMLFRPNPYTNASK